MFGQVCTPILQIFDCLFNSSFVICIYRVNFLCAYSNKGSWTCRLAVKKNNVVVGHLPLGCSGKFAKTIFYFLRADEWDECKVIVTGKPINCGDGDGMQVPCLLKFHGQKSLIGILTQQLDVMK